MIFEDESRVRLTKSELNLLRQRNAQNGVALNEVNTRDELLKAVIDGLPPEFVEDMLEFMERRPTHDTR
jgi:hypothetical protein